MSNWGVEDTLARLRSLHSDEERSKALEQYGQLKFLLAMELWDRDTLSLATGSRDQPRLSACFDEQMQGHELVEDVTSSAASAAEMPRTSVTRKGRPYDKIVENTIDWKTNDPRLCRKGHRPQVILRFKNQHCFTWKCDWCEVITAQQ